MGVKGFHEIPVDVIAGQIEAVSGDIGIQAAKTGMLASSAIISTVAETWRAQGLAGCGAVHRRSGVRLDARRPAAAPERTGFASRRTVSARNAGHAEPRRGAAAGRHRRRRRCLPARAARALHALGPKWALVKGGHLRSSPTAPTCCTTAPTSTNSTPDRIDTSDDHGAGDTLARRRPVHSRTATPFPTRLRSRSRG
jgi:hydroxymethylpyrimidine/phosphomethylpyrimidine kinase